MLLILYYVWGAGKGGSHAFGHHIGDWGSRTEHNVVNLDTSGQSLDIVLWALAIAKL